MTVTDIVLNGQRVGIGGGGSPAAPSNDALPIGAVIMWAGTAETIPEGWHICDGKDGTVDLRDKFVLGAGGKYNVGATGGSEEVTLTVEQMPQHQHNYSAIYGSSTTLEYAKGTDWKSHLTRSNLTTTNVGSSQPHSNMPPYYALIFIQKVPK